MSLNPQFGSGVLFGIPNAGNLAANPTPLQFPILQECTLDIKGDLKKLFGQQQFPIAKARGKIDVSVKGKIAATNPLYYSQLYFGQNTATGVSRPALSEAHDAASSVAPTHASATKDLGVVNAATGGALQAVTSGTPTTGQYKFTAAVTTGTPADAAYVFAAADVSAGLKVLLNYAWPDTAGVTLKVTNQLMGYAPEIQALLYNNFRGKLFGCLLYSCVLGSISVPTKQEDFWISDFDMDASCDASGQLLDIIADEL